MPPGDIVSGDWDRTEQPGLLRRQVASVLSFCTEWRHLLRRVQLAHGTIETILPGTTTTLRGAAPASSSTIRGSASAAACTSPTDASAATVIRALTLPLTWIGYSICSATSRAGSATGKGPCANDSE